MSAASFTHLLRLDLNFHKISSKNTVFSVSRAIRSIEQGMRFFAGFFAPIAFEFLLLSGMLGLYCGPIYLANMILTFALFAQYSVRFSRQRIVQIRNRKDAEKK